MDTDKNNSETMDEIQSWHVIREMIQVSRIKLKRDGILFIVWGWALFFVSISGYIKSAFDLPFDIKWIIDYLGIGIPLLSAVFTIYYLLQQRKKVQTYIGISLRYVWISLFLSLILVNLIQFRVLGTINFELQHPVFMVLMAFAVTVTGGILRYRLIIGGGVVFGLLALIASYLNLQEQLLLESLAWLIAFIIPGHVLFVGRKK